MLLAKSELCCQILAVQSLESLGVYEPQFHYLWSCQKKKKRQQNNIMANKMFRVEYNLKGNSCKIKAFKELRG